MEKESLSSMGGTIILLALLGQNCPKLNLITEHVYYLAYGNIQQKSAIQILVQIKYHSTIRLLSAIPILD